ncbi:MAG: SusD/RagB family nutrient-binding outer membrane lipoprotein [Siphonobacter sp.]
MKKYIVTGLVLLSLASCSKFEELNSNPDAAVNATAQMLATKLILNITDETISSGGTFIDPHLLDKSMIYTEFPEDLQYNYLGRASYSGLTVLTNVNKMINYSVEGSDRNSYTALGHFIRAWKFFNLTMQLGDIPYSDALNGESGTVTPTYDTQKEVFVGILNELDQADALFAEGSTFAGDPIYDGDINQWRKVVNTFELYVLLNLYKKTSDTDLNVVSRFKDIVATRPLFTSNADNFGLTYSDVSGQRYPFYQLNNTAMIYTMVSSVLSDKLKDLNDYRLFYYMGPSPVAIAAGADPSDWTSYIGTDPSMVYGSLTTIFAGKNYSNVNSRYTELANAEPVYLISYAQLQFMLAEAALRGWITTGTTEDYYNAGITAAMKFVADNTPDNEDYHHNRILTDSYITSYLASDAVKLTGSTENMLSQIITQKYLGTFLQSPYTAFFENRRTGYPVFPINTASNLNVPADKMPLRWLYPQNELDYNQENVTAAIASQYSGSDSFNAAMWILQ